MNVSSSTGTGISTASAGSTREASFLLQGIVDFLRQKTIKHGSISIFIEGAKRSPIETMEFLNEVVMPRHRYEIARQRVKDSQDERMGTADTSIKWTIFIIVVVWLSVAGLVFGYHEKVFKNVPTTLQLGAFIVALAWTTRIGMDLVRDSVENLKADAKAVRDIRFNSEDFFQKFENSDAIAIYYATTLSIDTAVTSNRKAIIKKYQELTRGKDGKQPRQALDIQTIIGTDEWNTIMNSCMPGYIDKVKRIVAQQFKDGNAAKRTTQLELEELNKIEQDLNEWNILYVYKHLSLKANELYSMVQKPGDGSDITDLKEVMKTQVLPLFTFDKGVFEIKDMSLSDPDAVYASYSTSRTEAGNVEYKACESSGAALLELTTRAELGVVDPKKAPAMIVQFDKNKGCASIRTRHDAPMPMGTMLHNETGNSIYIQINDPSVLQNINVFVDADAASLLDNQATMKTSSKSPGSIRDSLRECMKDSKCVAVLEEDATKASLLDNKDEYSRTSYSLIQGIERISTRPENGKGAYYKMSLSQLAEPVNVIEYDEKSKSVVVDRLLEISESYSNTVSFASYIDFIRSELEVEYDAAQLETIMIRVYDAFDIADEKIKSGGGVGLTSLRFMSKSAFLAKMDEYTVSQLDEMTNMVDKLHHLSGVLQRRVQTDIINRGSEEDNMFVEQQRSFLTADRLAEFMTVIGSTGYIIYALQFYKQRYMDETKPAFTVGFIPIDTDEKALLIAHDVALNLIFPAVVIVLTITMFRSWNNKRRAKYNYNRDVLEANTNKLINSLFITKQAFLQLRSHVMSEDKRSPSGTLKSLHVSREDKVELYDDIVATIKLLDRCNLITNEMTDVPFPITDVAINMVAIGLLMIVMVTVIFNIKSSDTISHIKALQNVVRQVKAYPGQFSISDFPELECDTEAAIKLKLAGVALFVVFGVYMSQQLVLYPSTYKRGLYLSKYYTDSRCVDGNC